MSTMIKKEKPMLSVTAIIQGAQAAQQWGRSLGGVNFGNQHHLHHHHHHMALGLSLDQNLSMGPLGGGPQSPLDMKPDASTLDQFSPQGGGSSGGGGGGGGGGNTASGNGGIGGPNSPNSYALNQVGLLSPSPSIGSSGGGGGGGASAKSGGQSSPYPPNHPLSGSKHLCSICGDRASGKHYGVYSCEGCKGFFKRTVRKDLTYACREEKNCIIDKRQRNRCQYCRYQKCLSMGMKREAVQEERQRTKDKDAAEVESSTSNNMHLDLSLERLVDAENRIDLNAFESINGVRQACNAHILCLLEWAKVLPHFSSLNIQDQVTLLKCSWNELHVISLAYRSVRNGDIIDLESFMDPSLNDDVDLNVLRRFIQDFVSKLQEIHLDPTEFACLRAIILFNPEIRGLICKEEVNTIRETIYEMMEEYVRLKYSPETGRFAKLLLRLPVLRSISLKCKTALIFFPRQSGRLDTFLAEILENIRNICKCTCACTCTPKLRRV